MSKWTVRLYFKRDHQTKNVEVLEGQAEASIGYDAITAVSAVAKEKYPSMVLTRCAVVPRGQEKAFDAPAPGISSEEKEDYREAKKAKRA